MKFEGRLRDVNVGVRGTFPIERAWVELARLVVFSLQLVGAAQGNAVGLGDKEPAISTLGTD